MASPECSTAVLCRLAHQHDLPINSWLDRLPRSYTEGHMLELEAIPTDLDVPRDMQSPHCILTRTYQLVVNYQSEKKHHQPLGRFSMTNRDQFLAKRLFCELSRETIQVWFLRSQGADDRVKPPEVRRYAEFVKHLLYYHHIFAAKRGTDFADLLIDLHANLERLLKVCSAAQRNIEFSVLLDGIHDAASRFCDHALGVVLLGTSSNHEELEKHLNEFKQDSICVETIRRLRSKSAPEFWATDLGLVISAILVRGGNTDFEPRAAVWTDSYGKIRRVDYDSFEEAFAAYEECTRKNKCAVLTDTQIGRRKNQSQLVGRTFHDAGGVWKRMNDRVSLHIALQHGAVKDTHIIERPVPRAALGNGDQVAPAALADRRYETSPTSGASSSRSAHDSNASVTDDSSPNGETTSSMLDPIGQIKTRWQQGELSYAGLAGPFRSKCQPLNQEIETGAAERSAQATSQILEVPMAFSEVLCAFKRTLGEARILSGGGTHQSLLAIHGLRKGRKIEDHLLPTMQQFVAKASMIHKEFESAWLQSFKTHETIPGQTPSMQRVYFESYTECGKLCREIENKWRELAAGLSEEEIGATFAETGKAYQRLSVPIASVPALTFSPSSSSTLQIGNGSMPVRSEPQIVD